VSMSRSWTGRGHQAPESTWETGRSRDTRDLLRHHCTQRHVRDFRNGSREVPNKYGYIKKLACSEVRHRRRGRANRTDDLASEVRHRRQCGVPGEFPAGGPDNVRRRGLAVVGLVQYSTAPNRVRWAGAISKGNRISMAGASRSMEPACGQGCEDVAAGLFLGCNRLLRVGRLTVDGRRL